MSHETVVGLLPWYANGTLADDERQYVEDHVRACLTCHLELKKERELHELVQSSPTVNLGPEEGFDKLSHRLDDSGRGGRRAPVEPLAWAMERLLGQWLAYASAMRFSIAAVVLLAVVGALSWRTVPQAVVLDDPAYVTLTSGSVSAGNVLDIVFADHVSELELRALVSEIDGSIVAGPTAVGRYRIRVRDGAVEDADLTNLIRALSRDERVRFAGPSFVDEETLE